VKCRDLKLTIYLCLLRLRTRRAVSPLPIAHCAYVSQHRNNSTFSRRSRPQISDQAYKFYWVAFRTVQTGFKLCRTDFRVKPLFAIALLWSVCIVTCRRVLVTVITRSSSDDWIYWHFGYNLSQIQLIQLVLTSHTALSLIYTLSSSPLHTH
jgi:hypothetical protein